MTAPTASLEHRLLERFVAELPAEAACVLQERRVEEVGGVLRDLPAAAAAQALQHLDADLAAHALGPLGAEGAAAALQLLDPVRAASLLARLDGAAREALLEQLPAAIAKDLTDLLSFPPQTAGSLMDARVTTFPETATVQHTLERIRALTGRRITDVVIASPDNDFVGVVPLQSLVGAPPDQRLSELVRRDTPHVQPVAPRGDAVDLMNAHKIASLPVVGVDGKVLGIIRYDALVDAAQGVLGDNMQQMVGANAAERALSSPWFSVRSRLPWLQINLLTAFLASAVVGLFDATIAQFTALAVLMPVVAGQSGNTGAQALAVTARGLALREIRTSHAWRVLSKEVIAALINGVAVAAVTSIGVFVWSSSLPLAVVIGVSMVLSMVLAGLAGGAIPIVLTALDRDPATASSIILTTVTDVCGFFSFLGLATLLSGWLSAS